MTELRAFLGDEKNDRERAGRRPQMLRLGVTLALTLATVASAQTYTVLKSFTGGSDGANPLAGLVLAGSTLYGTTENGGSSGDGVVFKIDTDGSGYAVLKSFSESVLTDGRYPEAGLVLAGSTLYGTTAGGGGSDAGVVFKVNTDGTGYAVLKNFTGSDGRGPSAGLVLAGSTLYGTAAGGGGSDAGVVFKVNTDGTGYAVLKSFTGSLPDAGFPHAGLVLAGSTLYGTTHSGGSSGPGVIFKVNTDGSGYALLKNFTGDDGAYPDAGLVLAGTTLYGTTSSGGDSGNGVLCYGVVFKVSTDGSGYAVLKIFSQSVLSDGQWPAAGLVLAGSTLYGTTRWGGSSERGVLFQVNTDGSGYALLKSFTGSDGADPWAGLVLAGSTLYGTTTYGGDFNDGVVFSLACLSITTPPWTQTAETGTAPWFWVEVTNTPPEATCYQWYFSGTNALGGATNSYLGLTNVQPVQAGAYTVVVTNVVGALTSAPALLSVIPPVERRLVPAVGLTGGTGSLLHLEYADSLVAAAPRWFSFTNVTLGGGPQFCFDLGQLLPAQRFYRGWQTNGPRPKLDMSMATEIPLTGAIGSSVRIDYINAIGPTNAWVTLDTVALTTWPQLYFDVTAFRQPTRLYRLVALP
jgi:uncharacterized repeat protein (TIGR03803 family)